MDNEPITFSVVIPAFNEADRIGPSLQRVWDYLRSRYGAGGFEVIVVDDGSRDSTVVVVERFMARAPELRLIRLSQNRGKGAAVRIGMMAATGRAVLFSDADLSTPIEEVESALRLLADGGDVVIGSRALAGSRILVRQHRLRELMGRLFNRLTRILLQIPFRDTQCGFKLFRREAAHAVFHRARIDGFAFDVEAILIAMQLGYAVHEIPVRWINDPASRVTLIRHPAQMLADLWRIWAALISGSLHRTMRQ
jgi:glycosyltransferase involved in cell wall biosynthesis